MASGEENTVNKDIHLQYARDIIEATRTCLKLGVVDKQQALEAIAKLRRRYATLKKVSELILSELDLFEKEVMEWR